MQRSMLSTVQGSNLNTCPAAHRSSNDATCSNAHMAATHNTRFAVHGRLAGATQSWARLAVLTHKSPHRRMLGWAVDWQEMVCIGLVHILHITSPYHQQHGVTVYRVLPPTRWSHKCRARWSSPRKTLSWCWTRYGVRAQKKQQHANPQPIKHTHTGAPIPDGGWWQLRVGGNRWPHCQAAPQRRLWLMPELHDHIDHGHQTPLDGAHS